MTYKLVFTDQALEDLKYWKHSGQKKSLKKIYTIFGELESHPYEGIGHPEPLRGNLTGKWSRQIDKKNRIVYSVCDDILNVEVITAKGHYGDK
ncbi:Txe/YoeB family addiction module toxin [Palleniella muris]|uniref:Txe/YoeB family addiction module toxin n=1 Tax=Palleniella muris TaxID=3038145 RepID=A0AC61QTY1_9BACT|nr:Txe/YoeB family addiction module toxin [Palleniella muris]TGX84065.1 Txe/YoeB family addiction module toxin [Palleniella muris]